MGDFEKTVAELQRRITQLEEVISLHIRREEIMPDLVKTLNNKIESVMPLVDECDEIFNKHYEIAVKEYATLMEKMKTQQLTMLDIMKEVKKKKGSNRQYNPPVKTFETPTHNSGNHIIPLSSGVQSMCLSDYKQSPYVSRLRPISLHFLDFEARITNKMFESIPKYLRGRDTLDELVAFLEQVIVPCFTEKYQIIYKKRSALRNPTEVKLWELYREQSSKFPGIKFITQGDISRRINKLIDKKMSCKIAMLRHLCILKEQKEQSTVYYLWVDRAE